MLPKNRVTFFATALEVAEIGTGNLHDPQNLDSVTLARKIGTFHNIPPRTGSASRPGAILRARWVEGWSCLMGTRYKKV